MPLRTGFGKSAFIWHDDLIHNFGITYMGIPMYQIWADLLLWEGFLNSRPSPGLASILELGTANGGFSLYLLAQCIQRGLVFHTVDYQRSEPSAMDTTLGKLLDLESHFHSLDVLKSDRQRVIELIRSCPRPMILFVDNGNKPLEFELYVPYLNLGDYVFVHDWGTEFNASDAARYMDFLEQRATAERERLGSKTVIFTRKSW